MKILHLTDLHFNGKIYPLLDRVKIKTLELLENKEIDFFIFSGDLVSAPNKLEDFSVANDYIIKSILEKLKLDYNSFFICEGNHDIQRNQELNIISETFSKFKKISEVEDFISVQKGQQLEASLMNHNLYFNFIKNNIYSNPADIIDPLYTIHKRTYNNKPINIVTINSAWRSVSSEVDPSNLFYPISVLNNVIKNLEKNAFKVLIMHHPLREFKEFIAREMEDIIYDNFQILLTGHLHKKGHSVHYTNDVGIFCNSSQAVFSKNNEGIEFGFSILDLDNKSIDFSDFTITNYFYNDSDNKLIEGPQITGNIPLGPEKEAQNKLRKTFKKRYEEGKLKANELLIFSNEDNTSFLEIFGEPVICDKPITQVKEGFKEIPLDKLLNDINNYLIFGKDKYGKTSLLYKIYLDLLDKFTANRIIPYFIDFKQYKFSNNNFDIISNFTVHCETSHIKANEICKKYQIKLLIDNYNSDNLHLNQEILKLIDFCPNISIIGTVEETLISAYQNHKLNNHSFTNLFIHEIGRTQIRTITSKVHTIEIEKKEDVIDRLQKMFIQLNFPFNYWTVSLFLWIYNKTKESNFHNNFELIQLYIDGLLERNKHIADKGIKINYEDLKEFLASLAYTLVKDYYVSSHSIDYLKLVEITNNYRKSNNRIVIETHDLIELILQRGIIKKLDNDRYSFRLGGVFEFFIAYYMKDNRSFALKTIADDNFYLSFYNEFELYSGFNRKDKAFLNAIFGKKKKIFNNVNKKFAKEGEIDSNLVKRIIDIDQVTKGLKIVNDKKKLILSQNEQDDIITLTTPIDQGTGEVKQKKFIAKIDESSEHLEKALFIMCRVFRNSNINDPNIDNKILDYILDSVCSLGFLLIDETKDQALEDNEITLHEKSLIKLIMEIMPIVVQTFLYEALAQNNLERLLEEKLNNLKKEAAKNQFKLFLVYNLLIDLDFKNKKHLINELINDMKLGVLRHSNLIKFYLYLAFKANDRNDLENEIQGYIRLQEKIINSKKDEEIKINKKIEAVKRIGRVQRKR